MELVLRFIDKSVRQVKSIGDGNLGEIRIGFLGSAMQEVIPKMLLELREKFPDIHTSLEELSNQSQVRAILKDEQDLGFVRLSRVPKGLNFKPVFEDTFSLVLPKNHHLT